MTWILTNSGTRFDFENPTEEMINIEDIAAALSKQTRFNGHCSQFYSVARHSIIMASKISPEFKLEALMHDATEAYIGDMVKPLKNLIPEFEKIENKIHKVIAKKFKLKTKTPKEIKDLDLVMVASEIKAIMPKFDGELEGTEGARPIVLERHEIFSEPNRDELDFLFLFKELYKSDNIQDS